MANLFEAITHACAQTAQQVKDYFSSAEMPARVQEALPAWAKGSTKPVYNISEIQGLDEYLLNKEHPIGSLYWSKYSTDPAELFGGTWERITDTFILAAGETFAPDTEGGEAEHVLTIDEMPEHRHNVRYSGTGVGYSSNGTLTLSSKDTPDLSPAALAVGGDQPHNNMPPYKTRYCWERVA